MEIIALFLRTRCMGTLLSLVHCMRKFTLLHQALVSRSHDGSSSKSVNTISSSSNDISSPSPLNVLKFILSADKFLVYLEKLTLIVIDTLYARTTQNQSNKRQG